MHMLPSRCKRTIQEPLHSLKQTFELKQKNIGFSNFSIKGCFGSNLLEKKRPSSIFIELTLENSLIVSMIDWNENTKYESVSRSLIAKKKNAYFYYFFKKN